MVFLIYLLVFVVVLWNIKLCAKWLGAKRTGWGWCFLAVIATMVLGFLGQIVVGIVAVFLGPLAVPFILVMSVLIPSFIYAMVLDSGFVAGIGIYLLSTLISIVMGVALFFILMFSSVISGVSDLKTADINFQTLQKFEKRAEGSLTLKELSAASDAVCACGEDKACFDQKMLVVKSLHVKASKQEGLGEFDKMRVEQELEKAEVCVKTPSKDNLSYQQDDEDELVNNQPKKKDQRFLRKKTVYQDIAVKDFPVYKGYQAKITLKNGQVKQGQIGRSVDKMIEIRTFAHGGSMTTYVGLSDVRSIEIQKTVYEKLDDGTAKKPSVEKEESKSESLQ